MKVSLQRLGVHYGKVAAVSDLDLEIGDGELFCLIGPSGCGKTTTLRLVAGLMNPDAGRIYFGDTLIADPPARRIVPTAERNLGMVFQSYALWPHLTVAGNIGLGLKLRKLSAAEIKTRINETLALVGLEGRGGHYPHQLSGGQQQRVALARAVALQPNVLLFDEPLSNLDAALREQMRDEIRNLQRRVGITAIYVTHDQTEALAISDRVGVMLNGRLVQCGTPEDLYRAPQSAFVAGFLGHANLLAGRIEAGRVLVGGTCIAGGAHAEAPAVTVMVRPEAIVFENGATALRGQIAQSTFLGDVVEYLVDVEALGARLRMRESTGRARRSGEQPVVIDPAGVVVVAGSASGAPV